MSGRREFKFSEEEKEQRMNTPISPSYFTKIPKGMEPQVWLRLKTTLALYMPPDPKNNIYPMSFDDKYWKIKPQPLGKLGNGYMLFYNVGHGEEQIIAGVTFQKVIVEGLRGKGNGYNVLNLKYSLYDCEISQSVNIRITPNQV
jgi:hypothetical protein